MIKLTLKKRFILRLLLLPLLLSPLACEERVKRASKEVGDTGNRMVKAIKDHINDTIDKHSD